MRSSPDLLQTCLRRYLSRPLTSEVSVSASGLELPPMAVVLCPSWEEVLRKAGLEDMDRADYMYREGWLKGNGSMTPEEVEERMQRLNVRYIQYL